MIKSLMATFDLQMTFPLGHLGKSSARKRLELAAREKLTVDIEAKGYRPIEETFRAVWEDSCNGKASVTGVLVINGEPST